MLIWNQHLRAPGKSVLWATLLVVLLGPSNEARAAILFSDTFNVPNVADPIGWDVNFLFDLPGRQGGTLAPLLYNQSPAPLNYHHQVGNAGSSQRLLIAADGAGQGYVSPNFNFTQNPGLGGYSFITFDVDPVAYGGGGLLQSSWAAVLFGASAGGALSFITVTDGTGVLFRGNGDYQVWNAGALVTSGTYTSSPAGLHHIEVRIIGVGDGNPFDGSGNALVQVFADNAANPFFTFTRINGYSNNYVGLQGNTDNGVLVVHDFDNFNIGVEAVPEPATLTLAALGAGGLLAYRRWRRRNRSAA